MSLATEGFSAMISFLLIDIYMLLQTQRATDEQAASVDQTTRLTGNQLFINGSGRNVCEGSVPLVRITDYKQPLNDTAVSQLVLNPKIKQYHQFYFFYTGSIAIHTDDPINQ